MRQFRTLGIWLVLLFGVGVTLVNIRNESMSEQLSRITEVLGWTGVGVAVIGGGIALVSFWSYGNAKTLGANRPNAVLIRSGALPALKAVVEDNSDIRARLAKTRPLGFQFLLLVDSSGIEIWHGRTDSPSGSLPRDEIVAVALGKTSEGLWTYNCVEIQVETAGKRLLLPFALKAPTGLFGVNKKTAESLVDDIRRLLIVKA